MALAASLETTSEADLICCMLLDDDRLIIGLDFPTAPGRNMRRPMR